MEIYEYSLPSKMNEKFQFTYLNFLQIKRSDSRFIIRNFEILCMNLCLRHFATYMSYSVEINLFHTNKHGKKL